MTCYMQEKPGSAGASRGVVPLRRWRTWTERLLSGFTCTNKENMRWTVNYKLKSCFCFLLDQINVSAAHSLLLPEYNTWITGRAKMSPPVYLIRGHVASQWSCVLCRLDVSCSLSGEAILPSLCSSDTYREPSFFPRIKFQAKIKSFNTFVREVKDSSLCGSAWTDASNTVLLTYLCEPATDFHSPNNTKELPIKQTWQQALCLMWLWMRAGLRLGLLS